MLSDKLATPVVSSSAVDVALDLEATNSEGATAAAAVGDTVADPAVAAAPLNSYIPEQMDRHLQSLCFSSSGRLLLGSTSLTKHFWTGSVWVYTDPKFAPSVSKSLTGLDLENGLCDAIFMDKEEGKKICVSLSNGAIEFYSLSFVDDAEEESIPFLEKTSSVVEHDDVITGLRLTAENIISCSYDRSIVALDRKTLALTRRFEAAHSDLILDVSGSLRDDSLVASAGQDGRVAVWDLRENKCRAVLHRDTSCPPTCLNWLPGHDYQLLVGDRGGGLSLMDVRIPKTLISSCSNAFQQQVYRVVFSNDRPEVFAACADSTVVKAFQIEANELCKKYESPKAHSDFVRGLAWNSTIPGQLYSCGWDQNVKSHSVDV